MNKSGLWKGVVHNRIGHFKFINVEILNDRVPRRGEPERGKWGQRYRQKPGSVQELLQRMNLQVEREREGESNISPRLEQTDSHLHGVECKVENLLLYVSLFGVPIALSLPFPFIPSRTLPQQLSSLYLIQLADSTDHDESFLFDFSSSYSSFSLSFSLHFSPLVSALLIFILTRYTSCSFLYHFSVFQLPFDFHTRFIRNILKPCIFNRRY